MKKKHLLSMILLMVIVLTACQPADTPTAPPPTEVPPTEVQPTAVPPTSVPTEEPQEEIALDVVGPTETLSFTMSELLALESTQGQAGIKSSTGEITPPSSFKGISLPDLLSRVEGFDETKGVSIEAKDGYSITFSYDQIINGNFVAYDPGTGNELKEFEGPMTVILAYEHEGQPIPGDEDGPLRLSIISEENKQVTDGHWAVKWVRKIVVKDLAKEWTVELEGEISETMDRATFESGAAPNCHETIWEDEAAQQWVGIPLWLMVGRVDDEIVHEGPAFNDEIADAGYTVEVIAEDGYSVVFESSRVKRNDDIIVAFTVNDNPLPDKYFPLRLVGDDLQSNEMIGNIVKISVSIMMPGPAVADPSSVFIAGDVKNELSYNTEDVQSMQQTVINVKHPKKDEMVEYEGVRLNTLLDAALPGKEASTLIITAFDGYSVSADLAAVRACQDCIIRVNNDNGFTLAMPDMDSSLWVKNVVWLELSSEVPEEEVQEEAAESEAEEVVQEESAADAVEISTSATAEEAVLAVSGLVGNALYFSAEDLQALEFATVTALHPKKEAEVDYEGVYLNNLLNAAQPSPDASKIVMTASDGYAVEIGLDAVVACPECLVAANEDGTWTTVMPDMESMFWVKDIVSFELK